jgi:CRP-like cAMP-binding protein
MPSSTLSKGLPVPHLDPSAFVADPSLLQVLGEHSTPIPCDGDRVLFRQGEPSTGLFILHTGEATLSMCSEVGQPILSVQAPAGSLLGLPGLIGNQPYSLTAVARTGAQVSFITRADFTAFMHSEPEAALKILQVLAAEVSSARRALY